MNQLNFKKQSLSFKEHFTVKTRNQNPDWKKMLSDKLLEKVNKIHCYRLEYLLLNKTSIFDEIIDECGLGKEEQTTLAEYFNKLVYLIENDNRESQNHYTINGNDSQSSVCPICYQPVIYNKNNVTCVNHCLNIDIPDNIFNNQFTIDNLLNLFIEYKKMHNCKETPNAIVTDNIFSLICPKCYTGQQLY